MHFRLLRRLVQVSKPVNGEDVKLNLVLHSRGISSRPLSISISVLSMTYSGSPGELIHTELREETLPPDQDVSIPIVIPWTDYWKPMVDYDVMKISVVMTDKLNPDQKYLAEDDIVLLEPTVDIKVPGLIIVNREAVAEVAFENPVGMTLTNSFLTLSGSGLWKEEMEIELPNLPPHHRIRAIIPFVPYKSGQKTLLADYDCSIFRGVKGSCRIHIIE